MQLVAVGVIGVFSPVAKGEMHVLVDQVGYETQSPKQALVQGAQQDHPQQFTLIDTATGKTVFTGPLTPAGTIDAWGQTYWTADFSTWNKPGHYAIETRDASGEARSCAFAIADDLLERDTLSNVLYYFKGQRASGLMDRVDRHLKLPGTQSGFVDVHGGWYDATGDYGIHLSHQNPTSYFNPQQVPLTAWSLLKSYAVLEARNDDNFSEIERRMLDEGLFGADFLVRMKRPGGSFFESITAPGREKLAQDRVIGNPNWRTQIKQNASDSTEHIEAATGPHAYEASFRSGGGMAIAALALASTMPPGGDFPPSDYLRTAEDAFQFLDLHNRELLNDGKENILDDYCALMAATELYRASHQPIYLAAADKRAAHLDGAPHHHQGVYRDAWRADDESRPYFHPSDAGLPVVSLLEYAQVASPEAQQQVRDAVERSLRFELAITAEVNNPFDYARQLVRMGNGQVRTAFFFPHDTEAAPVVARRECASRLAGRRRAHGRAPLQRRPQISGPARRLCLEPAALDPRPQSLRRKHAHRKRPRQRTVHVLPLLEIHQRSRLHRQRRYRRSRQRGRHSLQSGIRRHRPG